MPIMNQTNLNLNSFPPAPAPNVIPGYCSRLYNAVPELLKMYLYTYIYVWLNPYESFWMYPTTLDSYRISGYIWKNFLWAYTELDLRNIDSFF